MQKVVSLDVARRLDAAIRKAGVKGPVCELRWAEYPPDIFTDKVLICLSQPSDNAIAPAPDVPELMEWMPEKTMLLRMDGDPEKYRCCWRGSDVPIAPSGGGSSPADALAELAIWLLENKPDTFRG